MPASPIRTPLYIVTCVFVLCILSTIAFRIIPGIPTWIKPFDILSDITKPSKAPIPSILAAPKKKALPTFDATDTLHKQKGFYAFDDYYSDSTNRWQHFCEKLERLKQSKHGKVRIAWLGDSQIEGDIFIQDVRHILQSSFGGTGVGFVPISTNVPGFRRSINFTFNNGWTTYALNTTKKNVIHIPWAINGEVFAVPADSNYTMPATVTYTAVSDNFIKATLLYHAKTDAAISYTIDKAPSQEITLPPTHSIGTYTFDTDAPFRKIGLKMDSSTAGFYGVSFDNANGVYIDNYSLRGASGLHLMTVRDSSLYAWNKYFNYDLIVLQYGLNVVKAGTHKYDYYEKDLNKIITRLHRAYPNTAILLMGVSDRSSKQNGAYATMSEVTELLNIQMSAAQKAGCAYWSIYDAMGGDGAMVDWVNNGLANKDYTHLKPEGGAVLAKYFCNALFYDMNKYEWLKKHPQKK